MRRSGWSGGLAAVLLALAASASPALAAGPDLDLDRLHGKYVYLDFWASWCGPCRQSFPWMNELQRKLGRDQLVIIGVNVDAKRADADHFLADVPAEFRIAYDPDGVLAERYKVKGMPTSVLLDRDGHIVFVHEGFRLRERDALEQQVRAAVTSH